MPAAMMIDSTGRAPGVHMSSATNWLAPAKTRPLISATSSTLSPAWPASTPHTTP